jgi:hypothetical protein
MRRLVVLFKSPTTPTATTMKTDLQITVKSAIGLDQIDIEMITAIEKSIDQSLVSLGFSRTTTTKAGDHFELNYRQFGVCLGQKPSPQNASVEARDQ